MLGMFKVNANAFRSGTGVAIGVFGSMVYRLIFSPFVARITIPCTGEPASVRRSAWMIFDCRPEDVTNRST
jgi:hypothetical protein